MARITLFTVFTLTLVIIFECTLSQTIGGTIRLVPMQKYEKPLADLIRVYHSANPSKRRDKRFIRPSGFTFPGTKWCGPGSTAHNYWDLGVNQALDMCCRDHDHCEPELLTQNPELCKRRHLGFTVSSCDCDAQFKQCLESQNSMSSRIVTELYRQFIRRCFLLDPTTGDCELKHKVF